MKTQILFRIRLLLCLFMAGLIAAGLTTFFIPQEMAFLQTLFGEGKPFSNLFPPLTEWLSHITPGILDMAEKYPYIYYGMDWLGFAHIVMAILFIGPFRDPIKNIWVIEFGIIACILVIPAVLIFSPFRGIPFFWQLIDCSFGVFGIIPLWWVRKAILSLG